MSEEPWMKPVDVGSDLPLPRYRVGTVVFHPGTSEQKARLPCPDCLGARKLECVSPAGGKGTVDCPRCSAYFKPKDIPSLDFIEHVPHVTRLTIGLVTARSSGKNTWGEEEDRVNYMCLETGIGSGSVYRESTLYATEEEARAEAERMAEKKNADERNAPYMLATFDLGGQRIEDAQVEAIRKRTISEYGALARMTELLTMLQDEKLMGENGIHGLKDMTEHIDSEMRFITNYYLKKKEVGLLARVEAFLRSLDDQLQWGPHTHAIFAALEEERRALLAAFDCLVPRKEKSNDEAAV